MDRSRDMELSPEGDQWLDKMKSFTTSTLSTQTIEMDRATGGKNIGSSRVCRFDPLRQDRKEGRPGSSVMAGVIPAGKPKAIDTKEREP